MRTYEQFAHGSSIQSPDHRHSITSSSSPPPAFNRNLMPRPAPLLPVIAGHTQESVMKNSIKRHRAVLAIGCSLLATAAVAMPQFDDWNTPANLETLPGSSAAINTPAVDGCASISP